GGHARIARAHDQKGAVLGFRNVGFGNLRRLAQPVRPRGSFAPSALRLPRRFPLALWGATGQPERNKRAHAGAAHQKIATRYFLHSPLLTPKHAMRALGPPDEHEPYTVPRATSSLAQGELSPFHPAGVKWGGRSQSPGARRVPSA